MKRSRTRSIFIPGRVSRLRINPKDILVIRLQSWTDASTIDDLRMKLARTGCQHCLVTGPDVDLALIKGR